MAPCDADTSRRPLGIAMGRGDQPCAPALLPPPQRPHVGKRKRTYVQKLFLPFPSKRPPLALQTRSSTPPPLSSDRSRFFCSNARARSRARAEVDDGMAGEQEAALGTPPGPSPGWPSTRSADVDAPPPAAARTPSGTSQPTTSPGRHFAERSARGAQERPLLHLRTVRTVPVVETTQEHVSPTYVPNVTLHLRAYVRTHVTFPYVRTRTCI